MRVLILQQRLTYMMIVLAGVLVAVIVSVANVQSAYAATRTWTGGAGDGKFSTVGNWSTGVVPVTGDVVTFTGVASGTTVIDNDLSISLAGVILQDVAGSASSITYAIDDLALQDGATITLNELAAPRRRAQITSHFTGAGDVNVVTNATTVSLLGGQFTIAGDLILGDGTTPGRVSATVGSSTVSGDLVINKGSVHEVDPDLTPASYVINGGSLRIDDNQTTLTQPITFAGPNSMFLAYDDPACGEVFEPCGTTINYTISGSVTLNADVMVTTYTGATVNFTGALTTNGHYLRELAAPGSQTQLAGVRVSSPVRTIDFSGNLTSDYLYLGTNETGILSGVRLAGALFEGSTLKGTGTLTNLVALQGSTVNPGNSPGSLTVLDSFTLYGTYAPEILSASSFDQLIVGENAVNSPVVDLQSGAVLQLSLFDGWSIQQGNQFKILDNRSGEAVSGTFQGLAEGAQFSVVDGGVTMNFSISYVGGDGNDIVIAALNSGADPTPPGAPNTGAQLLGLASPFLPVIFGIITAGLILVAVRRRQSQR